uniref:hypothetical protein n=1 Tax=Klebsiella pneumoniae TaxID=573 RepID=UPI001F4B808A
MCGDVLQSADPSRERLYGESLTNGQRGIGGPLKKTDDGAERGREKDERTRKKTKKKKKKKKEKKEEKE